MPFGLTIGTERAAAFQEAIQDELTRRGYSQDADPVMAEYITIMVINNKTPAQVTSELEDLISTEIDPSFITWLFEEAAKGAPGAEATPVSPPVPVESPGQPGPWETPSFTGNDSSSRRLSGAPRNGIYQQALSQALPSSSAQKRSASARSPSPTHPNKSRRTDLPTGPRAMQKEGPGPRSLLDRVGGVAPNRTNGHQRDEIQRRIESVTGGAPDPGIMLPPGFPGMPPGMDVNAMAAANMVNPMMLQEMMMNQMAMMAQMASSMGMLNTNTGQFSGPGFPMPNGMPADMAMMQNGMNNFQGQPTGHGGRGRGVGRGGRGGGRGRGSAPGHSGPSSVPVPVAEPVTIASPTPVVTPLMPIAASSTTTLEQSSKTATYAIPERPQSPTLCKFGTKCSNAHCRYSHPSPVATAESGIVLSNDPCENGKNCKDKDCTRAHVSPAVLNPNAEFSNPVASVPSPRPTQSANPIPCRFGLSCTRPGCTFSHPQRPSHNTQHCRFGTACTRASCNFQHPPGRVLPSTFHRGLSTSGGMASVSTPETGSMGGSSHNKSMTFNTTGQSSASVKEKLEKQMKELEEKKQEMERAMKDAATKKEDTKPVAITA